MIYLLQKEKQGLAVFSLLTSNDKQAVTTISIENLSSGSSVKLITDERDKL